MHRMGRDQCPTPARHGLRDPRACRARRQALGERGRRILERQLPWRFGARQGQRRRLVPRKARGTRSRRDRDSVTSAGAAPAPPLAGSPPGAAVTPREPRPGTPVYRSAWVRRS